VKVRLVRVEEKKVFYLTLGECQVSAAEFIESVLIPPETKERNLRNHVIFELYFLKDDSHAYLITFGNQPVDR